MLDVGWYRTNIRSFEREIYVIPNSVFSRNVVLNVTRKEKEWRIFEFIGAVGHVSYRSIQRSKTMTEQLSLADVHHFACARLRQSFLSITRRAHIGWLSNAKLPMSISRQGFQLVKRVVAGT